MAISGAHGYYGALPRYGYYPEPPFVSDGVPYYYDYYAVPVRFRQPPFYDDGFIRDYRRHRPDLGRPGHLPSELVLVWRDEERGAGPWPWRNVPEDLPPCIYVVEPRRPHQHSEQTVELYLPLCCDSCERRVKDYLIDYPGVESVAPDQWEKKVVVVGRNLRPHDLLRSLQRHRHLHIRRSTFWEDRPR